MKTTDTEWSLATAKVGDVFHSKCGDWTNTVRYRDEEHGITVTTNPDCRWGGIASHTWLDDTTGLTYLGREEDL